MSAPSEVTLLIDRARRGEAEARNRLCEHLEPELLAYLRRQMGPGVRRWTQPEDLAQQVLLETLRNLDRLPPDADHEDLLRRLLRTAQSRVKDSARGHRRDQGESLATEGHDLVDEFTLGPVTRADTLRWLAELVRRLPPLYAEVVGLVGLEGYSYAEAGERLDLAPDTVRKRYERAREALREKLRDRGDVG